MKCYEAEIKVVRIDPSKANVNQVVISFDHKPTAKACADQLAIRYPHLVMVGNPRVYDASYKAEAMGKLYSKQWAGD
jgi:hypothetical protein